MLFTSFTFLFVFLPLLLLIYYLIPHKHFRNYLLFFASLFFYAWGGPKFLALMIVTISVNFAAGFFLGFVKNRLRTAILTACIIIDLGFLFYFKYFGFATTIINNFLPFFGVETFNVLKIVLPLGISFYTFQCMSYVIDVYRNPKIATRNIIDFGLAISFFPQLIAGPIVRYSDVCDQIKSRPQRLDDFAYGIQRFLTGLGKKVLIANVVAQACDKIFSISIVDLPPYAVWIAVLCYALQIYFDFSGYSDMAIGLGRMFGFKFLENFDYPYMSRSLTEFWRRWHISLSSWFRDYIYIPLGGNRRGTKRTYLNLLIVFFVTGLWHGASISFIVWGLGHGFLLIIERMFRHKKLPSGLFYSFISHFYVLFSVMVLWVFFRFEMHDAMPVIGKMFGFGGNKTPDTMRFMISLILTPSLYISLTAGIVFAVPWWKGDFFKAVFRSNADKIRSIKYGFCLLVLIMSYMNLLNNAYNPFIYFRF